MSQTHAYTEFHPRWYRKRVSTYWWLRSGAYLAFILRELNMNALLMVPLRVGGRSWGLVELYEMRLRRFSDDDVAVARFLVGQAERRLESVAPADPPRRRPPVYELPSVPERRGPRTR